MDAASSQISVSFDLGTILLEGLEEYPGAAEAIGAVHDSRVGAFRAEARAYRGAIEYLVGRDVPHLDEARDYEVLQELGLPSDFKPYPHQVAALEAWRKAGCRGLVVLPTGSGKTLLAHMAVASCRRSALVVVPTLDLVAQWVNSVKECLGIDAGIVGGGEHEVRPYTVITYDSAARHMEHLGNRFGFIIFDECHHLPGPVYSYIARMSIAPFRLGLTATPERQDGGEGLLDQLVGPVAYSSRVSTLAGDVLAPYRAVRILVDLTHEEEARYKEARGQYLGFCRERGLRLGSPAGWQNFLSETCRSKVGQSAFEAYLAQKNIPLNSKNKFGALSDILREHRGDRLIIFTHVNELAYRISRQYLVPVITHQTPPRERAEILARFGEGVYPAVVTSKVLNEGVDVPEANVGVILSGSSSVREHVQRLGRILRKRAGKEAMLYEVIARATHEESMSSRRRKHEAYRGRGAKR